MKKLTEVVVVFALTSLSVVTFVIIFYELKILVEAGEKIFTALNSSSLSTVRPWDFLVIFWALLLTSGLVFLLQLLKSIFDVTVKKMCDEAAKDIVNLFGKWTKK